MFVHQYMESEFMKLSDRMVPHILFFVRNLSKAIVSFISSESVGSLH